MTTLSHPLLPRVRPDIRAHDLHPRAGKREVEGPGVRGVGQIEAHHLAALDGQPVVRLAVHQKRLAEAAHQRVGGRLPAQRHQAIVAEQNVVEHQHRFTVGRAVLLTGVGAHQQVAVEAQLLLDVLAHVGVIPVDAGVGKAKPVGELTRREVQPAGRGRALRRSGDPAGSRASARWSDAAAGW